MIVPMNNKLKIISKYIENSYTVSDFESVVWSPKSIVDSCKIIEVVLSLDLGIRLEYEKETSFPWVVRCPEVVVPVDSSIDSILDKDSLGNSDWMGDSDCWNPDSNVASSKSSINVSMSWTYLLNNLYPKTAS